MTNGKPQIYLAGKVKGAKWHFAERQNLSRIADYFSSDAMDDLDDKAWNHTPPNTMGLDWVGCSSGASVVEECVINKLRESDLLIAYLDTSNAYGTIAEIAYVSALGKPCIVIFALQIEGETLHRPEDYEGAGEMPEDSFQAILNAPVDNHGRHPDCLATDAYWLVSCFPNVDTYRETDNLNLNSVIMRALKRELR